MPSKINKIGVLTSGGDSPGMNAAVRAVVRACAFHNLECVGIYQGYQGLIDNNLASMNARSAKDIINKGGTFLKSARCLEFRTPEGRKSAFEKVKKKRQVYINTLKEENERLLDLVNNLKGELEGEIA